MKGSLGHSDISLPFVWKEFFFTNINLILKVINFMVQKEARLFSLQNTFWNCHYNASDLKIFLYGITKTRYRQNGRYSVVIFCCCKIESTENLISYYHKFKLSILLTQVKSRAIHVTTLIFSCILFHDITHWRSTNFQYDTVWYVLCGQSCKVTIFHILTKVQKSTL